eukprot:TRINITY_DN109619_c0_g1_i1.p1 TRINITY_DN109619_c0_g1~~TRINITY_DN109619_c0_g1_i1.p1  ORF type:complete len:136 (+),score=34.72 TRINITY_DN109619_c0_g1_i1:126-533(+)
MQRLIVVLSLFSLVAGNLLRTQPAGEVSGFRALDKDAKTQMLVLVEKSATPCDKIKCGKLECPSGFATKLVEGHCCPYCISPDIKIEKEITGATGETGGKLSAFCEGVWCFPTLCAKEEVTPTIDNGQCCNECRA